MKQFRLLIRMNLFDLQPNTVATYLKLHKDLRTILFPQHRQHPEILTGDVDSGFKNTKNGKQLETIE